jgi:hypothetical protein
MADQKPKLSEFNPEPWVRSVLWIAAAILITVLAFKGEAFKINIGGVSVERGTASEDSKGKPLAVGTQGVTPAGHDPATTRVSTCAPKTRAIGGSCIILKDGGSSRTSGLNKQRMALGNLFASGARR